MTVEVKAVKVICPACRVEKQIEIPVFVVTESQDGMVKIQVPQGAVCKEHSFMAFVDKKFTVRGYQNADIEFSLGEKQAPQKAAAKDAGLKDFTIPDIIQALGPDLVATIMRAILVSVPVLMVDTFDLYEKVDKTIAFLRDMESDDLLVTCEKRTREELREKRGSSNNALVVVPLYNVITKSPFVDQINTRFESDLLRETLKVPDRPAQIIFLRKELVKITRIIDEFVKLLKTVDKIYEEDIPAFTREKFNYKLDVKNIDVIKEVVAFKHGKKLAGKIINKSLDKIRSDLW